VREHFNCLLWVALGQTPNIDRCQRLMYSQLTGADLPHDMDQDARNEQIKRGMVDLDILLVLDDVWDAEVSRHFCFLDDSTKSRLLLSSRVRGALSDCDIVDVGLPSEADAIQILVAEAGLAAGARVPPGAQEIAVLCKRLPLTLGIAGRLVKELDLGSDWSSAVDMIKQELTVLGRSAEDSVIATSLGALSGSQGQELRTLLEAFALVPEDVKVPLEALCWVLEARMDCRQTPSVLSVRRWTKLLIDRCLVIGPVDQPSLHDIVLDFASGCFTEPGELRAAQKRLVQLMRERRPEHPDSFQVGLTGWTRATADDRLSDYVVSHAEHHIRAAWEPQWADDDQALRWMDDFTMCQDAIPLAVAMVLGTTRCIQLARRAEAEGNWWTAALRWSATALQLEATAGRAEATASFSERGFAVICVACFGYLRLFLSTNIE
jgi:hypothetical protein